jgi:hypothetical protein
VFVAVLTLTCSREAIRLKERAMPCVEVQHKVEKAFIFTVHTKNGGPVLFDVKKKEGHT